MPLLLSPQLFSHVMRHHIDRVLTHTGAPFESGPRDLVVMAMRLVHGARQLSQPYPVLFEPCDLP
jgi:hypothetical protein